MSDIEFAKHLLADALRLDASHIPSDATMRSLKQWDSLAHMELIAVVEESLGCTLTMDEIIKMASLEGLMAVILSKKTAA